MFKERGPFHKYVKFVEKDKHKWKCNFCGLLSCGNPIRIRAHLAGIQGYGIKTCEKVEDPVRAEALKTFEGQGRGLDKSTEGTSGKGMEGTVFGASQSLLPSEGALNPNGTQNSNQHGCVPQQRSCDWLTGTGTASACPQDDNASNPSHMQNSNQLGCTLQQPSFYQPIGTGTASACPQDQGPFPPGDRILGNLDNTQQSDPSNRRLDAAHGNENAPSLLQHPMDSSALPFLDLGELLEPLEQSTHLEFRDVITLDAPLHSPQPNLHDFLPQNFREFLAEISKEIDADELHDPAVVSSLQIDRSLDVDGANHLLDCGQPRGMEVVPVPSNRSPTNIVQHPGQLPPRCDKEDGNDIRRFPSQTPMDIDPSTALQHPSDSHIFEATTVDSLVPEASTNPIGPSLSHASVPPQRQSVPHQSTNLETAHQNPTVPSSSQAPNNAPPPPQILPCGTDLIDPSSLPELEMNEGAPMTSHPNTGYNFEENRALKRKLELLYSKGDIMSDELDFGASLSLKEPRMEVVNLLASVEKLKKDRLEAMSEDCLPSHQQVDILINEAKDLMRLDRGLFEVGESKVGKLLEEKMVGEAFRRNTTKILEFLVGNQISRLGIYGMGGVGKTTIMVHIHNRLKEANYGNVLWIVVSQDFNTQRLQDDLWKASGVGKLQETDVRKRAAALCNRLTKSGKSTIILDDVWEDFDLQEVGIPDGIQLVLTTRSFEVCRKMQCKEMIKITPLSHIEAKSLFLEELGSKVDLNWKKEAILTSIVEECAGLPLAIITMARSMRGLTRVFEWKDFLEGLRESGMGQMDKENKILMKLKFSYDRLFYHKLQQCFLSCALYPEDESINKLELIEFFIDQGLIDERDTMEKKIVRGHTILTKLANVCLIEDNGEHIKMHDLIRDMALHVMGPSSIVKARKGLRRIPSEENWTYALEKVSLMKNEIGEFPSNMSPNCPKLSIFLLNKNSRNDVVIPDSFFKRLWGLKVLNLSKCELRELPDSISDLVNLRALLLRSCLGLCHIPYLGKLTSLRKLDVYSCVKLQAIKGLEMLVNLRCLEIANTNIKRLPEGTLGALLKLQYLSVQAVNVEDILKLCTLEALKCRFEDVDDFNRLVRVFSKQRNNPPYYDLKCGPQINCTETIENFPFCSRGRITYFPMGSDCTVTAGSESSGRGICILIPQHVQKLTLLNYDSATNLSDVDLREKLERLTIINCNNLRALSGRQDEEIIDIRGSPAPTPTPPLFPSLRVLIIKECPKLKYLFGHGPKFYLPYLRVIRIVKCEELVGIIAAITSPSLHSGPAFPSLEDIAVKYCDEMNSVLEFEGLPHFPKLRYIEAIRCANMEEIIGGSPPYMPVEEISLERLYVSKCDNLRKLLPYELLIHLRNLQSIDVTLCEGMVEMISGAGQGQEGSVMTSENNTPPSLKSSISLPKLNFLCLYNLPQLKSICEVPITCNSMEYLIVTGCPELSRIPLELQLCDIEDLPYIKVEGEEKWKSLILNHPDAQANIQSHLLFDGSCYILEGRHKSQLFESEGELSESEGESSDTDFEEV